MQKYIKMKLSKKGTVNIGNKTMTLIIGVIGIVILFAAAPELWTIFETSLDNISGANIPLVSSLTGIMGLVFGLVVLAGGLYGLFAMVQKR